MPFFPVTAPAQGLWVKAAIWLQPQPSTLGAPWWVGLVCTERSMTECWSESLNRITGSHCRGPRASELLKDHLPLQVMAELVHPEELTVIKRRKAVDVDLPRLQEETPGKPSVHEDQPCWLWVHCAFSHPKQRLSEGWNQMAGPKRELPKLCGNLGEGAGLPCAWLH